VCRCRSQLTAREASLSHHNAPLTPTGRLLLCQRIEAGMPGPIPLQPSASPASAPTSGGDGVPG